MGHGEPILRPTRHLMVDIVVPIAIAANSGHIEYNFGGVCISVIFPLNPRLMHPS